MMPQTPKNQCDTRSWKIDADERLAETRTLHSLCYVHQSRCSSRRSRHPFCGVTCSRVIVSEWKKLTAIPAKLMPRGKSNPPSTWRLPLRAWTLWRPVPVAPLPPYVRRRVISRRIAIQPQLKAAPTSREIFLQNWKQEKGCTSKRTRIHTLFIINSVLFISWM